MALCASFRSFGLRTLVRQASAALANSPGGRPKWTRGCSASALPDEDKQAVSVTFVTRNGHSLHARGKEGDTLLDVHNNNVLDIQGYGNCGGTMACSTCLVVLPEEHYESSLKDDMETENDMIDLSGSIHPTSRLGCQVRLTKAMDGMVVHVPSGLRDLRD